MSVTRAGVQIPTFIEPRSLSSKRARPLHLTIPPAPRPHSTRSAPTNKTLIHSRNNEEDLDQSFQQEDVPFFQSFFEIQERLGFGSFGDVYRVKNTVTGKLYAIKKSRRVYTGEGDRSRQLREVQRVVNIPYSIHLVELTRAWEESGHLYLQMELCKMSLAGAAEMVGFDEEKTWNVLIDVLLALHHLHSSHLVHLDVKPENVFMTFDPEPVYKLGDFGILVSLDEKRDITEYTEGDSRYLAPEVMQGVVTTAADIFSFGLSLIEISCHVDLPKGGALWHQLREGGELPEPCRDLLPPSLQPIITQMLHPDPNKRPSTKELFKDPQIHKNYRRRRWMIWRVYVQRCGVEVRRLLSYVLSLFTMVWWQKKEEVERGVTPEQRGAVLLDSSYSDDEETKPTPSPFASTPISCPPRKRLGKRQETTPTSRNLLKEFEAVSRGSD